MNKEGGFTLIELLIASGVFIILVSLASGAFIQTLRTQRVVTNLSASMNNVSFTMEQIAREVRTGFSFNTVGDSELNFTNSSAESVSYEVVEGGIQRCADGNCKILTAPDVNIDKMEFILQGASSGDNEPPRVTILFSVVGEKDIRVNMQTTISSRILDT